MKKILTLIFTLASFAFADKAFLDKVTAYVSQKTGQVITATQAYDLKSSPNIKFVILKDSQTKNEIPVFVSKDAQLLLGFSNLLFLSDEDLQNIQKFYPKTKENLDNLFSAIRGANSYISDKLGTTIKTVDKYALKSTSQISFAVLEDTTTRTKIPVFIVADKHFIGLSSIFIPSDNQDLILVQDIYKKIEGIKDPDPKVLDKFFSSLKQTRYISLKSTSKKPKKTIYMVSDPRCPGCRKELGEVENKLKDADVKILLVAFLGEESANKASVIYERLIGVKDNAKKLKIMREVYNPDYVLTPKDKKLSTKAVMQNNEEVVKVGIQGVPFEHAINK